MFSDFIFSNKELSVVQWKDSHVHRYLKKSIAKASFDEVDLATAYRHHSLQFPRQKSRF